MYRVAHDRDIRHALAGASVDLTAVALGQGKEGMLGAIASALGFPDWFGANWDALEDCLTDLSWRKGAGHVILFSAAVRGDDLGILTDVLGSAAEFWRERSHPFFAVFIDPPCDLPLPALYREKTG